MQNFCVTSGQFSHTANIRMLPIIDMNPNDGSCIYSTLYFVESEAKRLNMQTVCITFDQPLWLKAVEILKDLQHEYCLQVRRISCSDELHWKHRLYNAWIWTGCSFTKCYGHTSIIHMLSGKFVARAVYRHFLVESALTALTAIMLQDIFNFSTGGNDIPTGDDCINLLVLYNKVTDKTVNLETDNSHVLNTFNQLKIALADHKANLAAASQTAKLWLQYIHYVNILKRFYQS